MVKKQLVLDSAEIIFRNFSGKESKFNPAGRRNFCVKLDPVVAEDLREEGWNIRQLAARNDNESPQDYMQVAVSFDHIPPKIMTITSNGKTMLDEDTVDILDWADISNVDLIIRPYNWEVNGKTGVKAYVKVMYVTLEEDEFAAKYADPAPSNDLPF